MKSGNKFRFLCVLPATLLLVFSGTANAQWDTVIGEKLENLFANKTHSWNEGDTNYEAHYEPGGDLMMLVNDELRPSFWRIYAGTSFCIVDRAADKKSCYRVEQSGGSYRLMQRDSIGEFELTVRDGIKSF